MVIFRFGALVSVFAVGMLAFSCASNNANFCDENTACEGDQVCNLVKQSCETPEPIDSGPALCEQGNRCVESIPSEWIGPMIYATATESEALPACSGDFSDELATLGSEDVLRNGSCDCQCGTVSGVSCGNAIISLYNGTLAQCNMDVATALCGNPLPAICSSLPIGVSAVPGSHRNKIWRQNRLGSILGGSCSPPVVVQPELLASDFVSHTRLCQANTVDQSCLSDEVCAPEIPADFSEQSCIARQGDFECPAESEYSVRTLLYESLDDQRSCDGASCACNASGSCRGTILLEASNNILISSTPGCLDVTSAAVSYTYDPDTSPDCGTTGEAIITGTVVSSGAMTLCCTSE